MNSGHRISMSTKQAIIFAIVFGGSLGVGLGVITIICLKCKGYM